MPEVNDVKPTQDTSIPVGEVTDPKGPDAEAALKKAESGLDPNKASTLLAGKYKSVDDLYKGIASILPKALENPQEAEKFYKTLESRMGTPADKRGEVKLPDPNPPAEPSADTKGTEPSKPSGDEGAVDFTALGAEFAENGALAPESYEKLQKAGFDKAMVDTYLTGIKSQIDSVHALAGGKEVYTELLDWGVENYSEAERNAFDEAIQRGSVDQRKAAIDILKARYTQATGPMKRISPASGDNMASGGAAAFQSRAELLAAMNDPRYGKDPAYERELLRRIAVSKNI